MKFYVLFIDTKQWNACQVYHNKSSRTRYLCMKNKTNNNKHVIYQLYNMQFQKEVKSNPKTAQLLKSVWPLLWKRCEIQSGSQEMAVMVG